MRWTDHSEISLLEEGITLRAEVMLNGGIWVARVWPGTTKQYASTRAEAKAHAERQIFHEATSLLARLHALRLDEATR